MCSLAKNACLSFGHAGFPTNYIDMGTLVGRHSSERDQNALCTVLSSSQMALLHSLPLQVSVSSMLALRLPSSVIPRS